MAEIHVTVSGVVAHNPSNQAGTHPLPASAGQTIVVNTTAKTVHGDVGKGLSVGSIVFDNPA